jgi:trimethylamine--corrinoid protein Co-methyltransferase
VYEAKNRTVAGVGGLMKKRISIPVDRPKINVLNKEKIQQIHDASLEILQKVGVKVLQPDARDLLAIAGAEVINDELVKIPPRIVEECLDMAPRSISVYDRDGNPAIDRKSVV